MMLRKQPKKPKRTGHLRSPGHRAFVRTFNCLVPDCWAVPVEAAHLRIGSHAGVGEKPSDEKCFPLCRPHHFEQHSIGEISFAAKYKLDIEKAIAELCRQSPALKRLKAKGRTA